METIFTNITDYLLNQTWQIAILFAVVAGASFAIRKKTAHLRYLLWLLILAKCLVPSLVTVSLAVLPQRPESLPLVESAAIPEFVPAPVPVILREAKNLSPPTPLPVRQLSIMARLAQIPPKTWFSIIWLGGVSLYLIIILIKAARFNHRLGKERKPLSTGMQKEIDELLGRFGIHAKPHIWLLDGIGQPFVWGLLRGSVYLPANFGQIGSREHRRGILMHEITHTVRFDAAVNLLQTIAQTIFWFHPLVWWANRNIRAEREKCCDETAIARLSAAPKVYSSAIVDTLIAEYQSTQPVPSLAIAGPIKNIEDRIKTIMKPGKKFYNRPTTIAIITILLLAIAAVPTTIALTHRQAEKPEEFLSKSSLEYTSTLPNGVTVELVGVCWYPSEGKKWWQPDGAILPREIHLKKGDTVTARGQAFAFVAKLVGPEDMTVSSGEIGGSYGTASLHVVDSKGHQISDMWALKALIDQNLAKTTLRIGIARGSWETRVEHDGRNIMGTGMKQGGINFSQAYEANKGVKITISDDLLSFEHRIIAIDTKGTKHLPAKQPSTSAGKVRQTTAHFRNLQISQISRYQFQTRPYEWVTFKNVSLKPNFKTDVQAEVGSGRKVDYSSVTVEEGVGFDDIIVGCTGDFIKSRLGKPDKEVKDEKDWWLNYRGKYGLGFWLNKQNVLREIRLNEGFKGKLISGISMTSTMKDVFDVYGKPVSEKIVDDLTKHFDNQVLCKRRKPINRKDNYKIFYNQNWLLFWFEGDKVSQIVIYPKQQTPDVQVEILTDKPPVVLDLDSGKTLTLEKDWPDEYDVGWDNDGGGALFCSRAGTTRMLPISISPAQDFADAISVAFDLQDRLKDEGLRDVFAQESKYVVVKTSQDNIAVLEIVEYSQNKAKVKWKIIDHVKKPDAQVEAF